MFMANIKRSLLFCTAWLGLLPPAPARCRSAADQPLLAPARDAEVTYYLTGASRTNGAVVMRLTTADQNKKVRLDLFNSSEIMPPFGSVIFDADANRVLSLLHRRHVYYELPATGRANPALMLNADMAFTRLGTATIAEQTCTDWRVANGPNYQGTACVTDDGVVLRATRSMPQAGSIVALSVNYAAPAANLFQPDPGFRLLQGEPRDAMPLGK